MTKDITVALAGQPNCGKSTIFNMLTGANQHVANYPGVTVEKMYGSCTMCGQSVRIVDLPGTYSLSSYSPEELAARQFLLDEHPNILLDVADASTLDKSLYLTLQVLEMELPVIMAMNMIDVAAKRKISVDVAALSAKLGIPVIPVNAAKSIGKKALQEKIVAVGTAAKHEETADATAQGFVIDYGEIETSVQELITIIKAKVSVGYPLRWLAVKLLEADSHVMDYVAKNIENGSELLEEARLLRERIQEKTGSDAGQVISLSRHKAAREIAEACVTQNSLERSGTEKIDAFVCHKVWGPIFLVAVLFAFYHASVTFGNYLAAEAWPIWARLEVFAANLLPAQGFLHDSLLTSLGVWVVKSTTAVLNYLPIFLIMFSLVAILEDSGYLARIAFVLDRIFRIFGLHGQSTLPLILGGVYVGGCAIPGVMATKAIPDERARFATIMIVPMMNCLAKVPLYLLLIGVFFADCAGSAMFFMGTVTLLMGVCVAKVLSLTVLRHKPCAPFIIELPIYHLPTVKGVFLQTMSRIWLFIKKILTVVIAVSVIVFVLISYPNLPKERLAHYEGLQTQAETQFMSAVAKTGFKDSFTREDIMPLVLYQTTLREMKLGKTKEEAKAINERELQEKPVLASIVLRRGADGKKLAGALRKLDGTRKTLRREMRQERFEKSLIGRAGKSLEGITAGAGFSWRINVALLSALAAKENSAATLGAIYGIDGSSVGKGFTELESGFTPLHALALMLFMALYPPCLPTMMMVRLQTGSTKWTLFSVGYQIVIGFLVATFVFSGATALGLNGTEAMWTFYGICIALALILGLIPNKPYYGKEGQSVK